MELDFQLTDFVNYKENQLEEMLLRETNTTNIPKLMEHIKQNNDIFMLRTIMTIMMKVRSKSIYMKDKIDKSKQSYENKILMTEEVIKGIYLLASSWGIAEATEYILANEHNFNEILLKYFSEKSTNYILEKFFIQTICEQNREKETLTLNPYMLNELLDIKHKPLTKEELVIREVIDYYLEAQQYYQKPHDIMYVKKLMVQNNLENERRKYMLLFMLGDVYQESWDRKDFIFNNLISTMVTSKDYPIISALNKDQKLINKIIRKFIEYNLNIEEGRLEDLEKEDGYGNGYARQLYKKKP